MNRAAQRRGAFESSTNRFTVFLGVVILWLAFGLVTGQGASGSVASVKVGDTFPDLETFGLEGSLPSWKGKLVLVDFFASWCEPCKDSFPVLQDLHHKYAARGLIVIAVNVDRKKDDMTAFLQKFSTDFTVVRDGANKLVSAVKIPTMPSSFLLDRDGKVLSVHRGYKGGSSRQSYVEEIERHLK